MLLMVANVPWQKAGERQMTSAEDRLAMVKAAIVDVEGLEACRLEIDRGGPSYTVDTLDELHSRHPDAELFLVLGADAAAGLPTWERWERVPELAEVVAVDRPGADRSLPVGLRGRRLEVPRLEVSSTDLRRRVADGRPIDFLVPPGVVTCIAQRRLYRGSE
jgi:nicotinate-nucleotide adenylyltransferase